MQVECHLACSYKLHIVPFQIEGNCGQLVVGTAELKPPIEFANKINNDFTCLLYSILLHLYKLLLYAKIL